MKKDTCLQKKVTVPNTNFIDNTALKNFESFLGLTGETIVLTIFLVND